MIAIYLSFSIYSGDLLDREVSAQSIFVTIDEPADKPKMWPQTSQPNWEVGVEHTQAQQLVDKCHEAPRILSSEFQTETLINWGSKGGGIPFLTSPTNRPLAVIFLAHGSSEAQAQIPFTEHTFNPHQILGGEEPINQQGEGEG